jgi:hypothetical protein
MAATARTTVNSSARNMVKLLGEMAWLGKAALLTDLRPFRRVVKLVSLVLMFAEKRFRTLQVGRLNPEFDHHSRRVADARFQVITQNLATNPFVLERLLPEMGLKCVWGGCQANKLGMNL